MKENASKLEAYFRHFAGDPGPAAKGHDGVWLGEQRQTQLPQPRHPWTSVIGPPGRHLPPPRPARDPPAHDEASWLSTTKPPALLRNPVTAENGPNSGRHGHVLSQSSRPQPRAPTSDPINEATGVPKRPQPSLFVDQDDQGPAAQREQEFPPLKPTGGPVRHPRQKLHLRQNRGSVIPIHVHDCCMLLSRTAAV